VQRGTRGDVYVNEMLKEKTKPKFRGNVTWPRVLRSMMMCIEVVDSLIYECQGMIISTILSPDPRDLARRG
jgi:hypothetical protein